MLHNLTWLCQYGYKVTKFIITTVKMVKNDSEIVISIYLAEIRDTLCSNSQFSDNKADVENKYYYAPYKSFSKNDKTCEKRSDNLTGKG